MAVRTTGRHAGDTKSRILDAAETLFIECGYEAMSLRQITSRAEVNLAAVNYHFGSKESLIHSMLSRRLDRLNQERLKLLDRFDEMLGARLTCAKEFSDAIVSWASYSILCFVDHVLYRLLTDHCLI